MFVNPRPKPPLPGGEFTFAIDTGPQPVRPGVSTVTLIPVGDSGPGPLLPLIIPRNIRSPLLPSVDEIAKLPKWARVAFATRCVERVSPTGEHSSESNVDDSQAVRDVAVRAASAILLVSSDSDELRYIRRDFSRFAFLARKNAWTDETPVLPDVIGPLWPRGRVPRWARKKTEPQA